MGYALLMFSRGRDMMLPILKEFSLKNMFLPWGSFNPQQPNRSSKIRFYGRLVGKILLAISLLVTPLIIKYPYLPKTIIYEWFRLYGMYSFNDETSQMLKIEGKHFIVKFEAIDKESAELVLKTAEEYFEPISEAYNFRPSEMVPIVIYPSREELGRSFGWDANESAMGVYYSGAIRILSPREWIIAKDKETFIKTFQASGPIPHEYTHLVVDYLTQGNYPRWFTEGVAQYEEYRLTGFRFRERAGSLSQKLYAFNQMDREFDNLPNQSLAYRQSFAAVQYIIDKYGADKIQDILEYLGRGYSLNQAFTKAIGVNLKTFEINFRNWVHDNINILENNLN
jgi:hypothetical protein